MVAFEATTLVCLIHFKRTSQRDEGLVYKGTMLTAFSCCQLWCGGFWFCTEPALFQKLIDGGLWVKEATRQTSRAPDKARCFKRMGLKALKIKGKHSIHESREFSKASSCCWWIICSSEGSSRVCANTRQLFGDFWLGILDFLVRGAGRRKGEVHTDVTKQGKLSETKNTGGLSQV